MGEGHVEHVKQSSDKLARIQALQAMVKNGTIQFSRRHITLLEQMKFFPKGKHDDGLDALEMAVQISLKASKYIGITFVRENPFTGECEFHTI